MDIEEIDKKLDMIENDEMTINLLYEKIDLLDDMLKEKEEEINFLKVELEEKREENMENIAKIINRENAIEKQHKIIDLMSIFISNLDIDEKICKYQVVAFCDDKPEGVAIDVCAKCIRQYFENKVKEEEEGDRDE